MSKPFAGVEPAPNRPDPAELLEEQGRTRLPELNPIAVEHVNGDTSICPYRPCVS